MTTRHGDMLRRERDTPHYHMVWHVAGAQTAPTTTLNQTEYANMQFRLVKAVGIVETAPTGATMIVDINDDGTTVFGAGTKLVIAIGATTGTQTTIAAPIIAAGSLMTIDVDQVGSGVAGSDLTVHLFLEPIPLKG